MPLHSHIAVMPLHGHLGNVTVHSRNGTVQSVPLRLCDCLTSTSDQRFWWKLEQYHSISAHGQDRR